MIRCVPWPLAAVCWLDNRSHERHGDGPEVTRVVCGLHRRVARAWWCVRRLRDLAMRGGVGQVPA